MSKKLKIRRIGCLVVLIILTLGIGSYTYTSDYYRATSHAEKTMALVSIKDDIAVFDGGGKIGFIFYPGGKVEYSAYAPLMKSLQEKGITCVLIKMPLNLAVLDADAWKEAMKKVDGIETWYIGGHSLGGAMATSKLDESVFSGVILLGAYPTKELSIPVLSIYGSEDGVMNREKYEESKSLIKGKFQEVVIEGGNHAGYGTYGKQEGDGEAEISNEKQIEITAEAIDTFIKKK